MPTAELSPLPAPEPAAASIEFARSVEGRPIELRTSGHGPARVLIIGLIHGDEDEAYARFDDLWIDLVTAGHADDITLHAIPTMNPDGFARRVRGNARGVDLNRNWPASNFSAANTRGERPLSEPETAAVHRHLMEFRPDVLVVLHSMHRGGPLVDPDGPANDLARTFVAAARPVDPRWRVQVDFTNPPGSLGTFAGLDLGIATLTVELRRGTAHNDAYRALRAGMLGVLDAITRRIAQGTSDAVRLEAELVSPSRAGNKSI